MTQSGWMELREAGTIILALSILMWLCFTSSSGRLGACGLGKKICR